MGLSESAVTEITLSLIVWKMGRRRVSKRLDDEKVLARE